MDGSRDCTEFKSQYPKFPHYRTLFIQHSRCEKILEMEDGRRNPGDDGRMEVGVATEGPVRILLFVSFMVCRDTLSFCNSLAVLDSLCGLGWP